MSEFNGVFGDLFSPTTRQDPKARLLLDVVTKAPEVKLRELRDLADAMGFITSIHLGPKPTDSEHPEEKP